MTRHNGRADADALAVFTENSASAVTLLLDLPPIASRCPRACPIFPLTTIRNRFLRSGRARTSVAKARAIRASSIYTSKLSSATAPSWRRGRNENRTGRKRSGGRPASDRLVARRIGARSCRRFSGMTGPRILARKRVPPIAGTKPSRQDYRVTFAERYCYETPHFEHELVSAG